MSEDNGSTYTELIRLNHKDDGQGGGKEFKTQEGEEERRRRRRRRRRWCIGCGSFCAILVVIVIVLVILGFTVLRPKNPKLSVEDITLEDFQGSIGLSVPPRIHLNVTLGLVVTVYNPNRVGFKYSNSTTHMFYRDVGVGVIPIPAGTIGARRSTHIVSHLDLLADRILSNANLIQDFLSGSLPFSTTTDISGHVNVLNLFHPHIKATSRCNINVSISDRSTQYVCDYSVKL